MCPFATQHGSEPRETARGLLYDADEPQEPSHDLDQDTAVLCTPGVACKPLNQGGTLVRAQGQCVAWALHQILLLGPPPHAIT